MKKEDKQAIDAVTIDMTKDESMSKFMNIRQNIDRSIRLVELDAPLAIINNEIRMIQRRALLAGAYYEEYLEMKRETI